MVPREDRQYTFRDYSDGLLCGLASLATLDSSHAGRSYIIARAPSTVIVLIDDEALLAPFYDEHSHKHLFAPARMRASFDFLNRTLISAVDA